MAILPWPPTPGHAMYLVIGAFLAMIITEGVDIWTKLSAQRKLVLHIRRFNDLRSRIKARKLVPYDELRQLVLTLEKAWLRIHDPRRPDKHEDIHDTVVLIKQYCDDAMRIRDIQRLITKSMGFDAAVECLRLITLLESSQMDEGVVEDSSFNIGHKLALIYQHTRNRVQNSLRNDEEVGLLLRQLAAAGRRRVNRKLLQDLLWRANCLKLLGINQTAWEEAITGHIPADDPTTRYWMKKIWRQAE